MQHFVFGSLFPASWQPSRQPVPSESAAHLPGVRTSKAAAAAGQDEVPVDDGIVTVAPWTTEPLCLHPGHTHSARDACPAGGAADPTLTGVAPWARPAGGGLAAGAPAGAAGSSAASGGHGVASTPGSVMDTFIDAFGGLPRAISRGRSGSGTGSPSAAAGAGSAASPSGSAASRGEHAP